MQIIKREVGGVHPRPLKKNKKYKLKLNIKRKRKKKWAKVGVQEKRMNEWDWLTDTKPKKNQLGHQPNNRKLIIMLFKRSRPTFFS